MHCYSTRNIFAVVLAVATLATCFRAQALQQQRIPFPNNNAAGVGKRRSSALHMAAAEHGKVYAGLSRRETVLGGVALGLGILGTPGNARASQEDDDPSFRVLFQIQIAQDQPLAELEIEVRPDWAPLGAQRFKELIEAGFYNNAPFFRVLPGYVAQFGISSDPSLNKQWVYCDITDEEAKQRCQPSLKDKPRTQPNQKGTLSFASSGKNSRKTQVFVNLANNDGPPNFLDAQNFVPFARVVRGMEALKQLNGEYGGRVNQGKAAYYGGDYFQQVFPKLSVIKEAKIIL